MRETRRLAFALSFRDRDLELGAYLGIYFNVDEISRLEKIELDRRQLSKNDNEVFEACIAKLKQEKQAVKDDGDEQLKYIRELYLKNKEQK